MREAQLRDLALRVLRRAVELGVDLIDTADSYGPNVAEELIRDALHPYPATLKIATKAGLTRSGPNQWASSGRPEYLRQQCEGSLTRLGVEQIDLFQLHRVDPEVPADEQFGLLRALREEGKVREVGLSEVGAATIRRAAAVHPIVDLQIEYSVLSRGIEDAILPTCRELGIAITAYGILSRGLISGSNPTGAGDLAPLALPRLRRDQPAPDLACGAHSRPDKRS